MTFRARPLTKSDRWNVANGAVNGSAVRTASQRAKSRVTIAERRIVSCLITSVNEPCGARAIPGRGAALSLEIPWCSVDTRLFTGRVRSFRDTCPRKCQWAERAGVCRLATHSGESREILQPAL